MAKYVNRGKRQYGEREKRAYSAGVGYGCGKKGRRVALKTEKEKRSFRNGYNKVPSKSPGYSPISKSKKSYTKYRTKNSK